jgi:hypothetical protein
LCCVECMSASLSLPNIKLRLKRKFVYFFNSSVYSLRLLSDVTISDANNDTKKNLLSQSILKVFSKRVISPPTPGYTPMQMYTLKTGVLQVSL